MRTRSCLSSARNNEVQLEPRRSRCCHFVRQLFADRQVARDWLWRQHVQDMEPRYRNAADKARWTYRMALVRRMGSARANRCDGQHGQHRSFLSLSRDYYSREHAQVRIWDPATGKQIGDALRGHQKWITSLAWEPAHL